jgi:peptidylprolyl isomerase
MRTPRLVVSSLVAATLVLSACGDEQTSEAGDTTAVAPTDVVDTTAPASSLAPTDTAAPTNPDKPEVSIPAELPTELVVTDLVEGTGPAAAAGDLVVVDYVGVRSADGTEFDNSYDRGQPFPVTLGAGGVIQGWDDGLVGIKAGGRRQLDIPAELAYGDAGAGDIIQPGDALTFVIEARAIVALPDSSAEPDVTVEGAANVTELATVDLVTGEGDAVTTGDRVYVHIIAYRADTGEKLNSTWADGQPFDFALGNAETLPGIEAGVEGMQVGGRRQITIPFAEAFGAGGNENLGLPPDTDLVIVIDLVGAY